MFEWAREFEDLYKVCNIFNLREIENPVHFSYKPLKGYIQDGPQCGLVALAIICGNPSKEFIENIFEYSKLQNFSYNGEIFSVRYMEQLAKWFLEGTNKVVVFQGRLNCSQTKEHLLNGGFILTPYDTDKNNYPGLYNGHKAHWAVLCGCVETDDGFYVIARHGKARNIAVWKLDDLSNSNMQLNEFSPDRKCSNLKYKIPEGGLSGDQGLKGMAVFIQQN